MTSQRLELSTLLPNSAITDTTDQTFIGIDFGTSTTTVSYARIKDHNQPIEVEALKFQQRLDDGRVTEGSLVPTAIAWFKEQLLIGKGAWQLKHKLTEGRDLWHSFKMKLGTDLGAEHRNTLLGAQHRVATIERPLDAAKVFFRFIKQGIDTYVEEHHLPPNLRFAVSIPASFESNQRRDLLTALESAGIAIAERAFIDEPNAAFLSYIADFSANHPNNYQIPDGKPLQILVFDFGAGTCDISVLEVAGGSQSLQSRNTAISRFVALGGNDIDAAIARDLLLPQVLEVNELEPEELRTAEQKRLINALLGAAEKLKIKLCENVSTQMVRLEKLPVLAHRHDRLKVNVDSDFKLPKRTLIIPELSVSYAEFAELMTGFLDIESNYDTCNDDGNIISIFTPIHSALRKAEIDAQSLDMILLIGGSARNPYVQHALAEAFPKVDIERPHDLQIHVSRGAAIHSALLHGLAVDLIRPITSEPILYLTRDGRHPLVKAGTEIPCPVVRVEPLYPHKDGQQRLEIPLFVSSLDQLLHVIEIESEDSNGFLRSNQVTLQATLNADKLVMVEVYIDGRLAQPPHYLNPFANRPVSPKERSVYEALRAANDSAANRNGRPDPVTLRRLANAYETAGNHLRCAEVYESLQQLQPNQRYETSICYHYSCAGRKKLSDEWAEIAYRKNPSAVSAFNLALIKVENDKATYRRLMEEAIQDRTAAYAMLTYGQFLINEGDTRAESLINRAFQLLWDRFEAGELELKDYSRLISAARLVGRSELIPRIKAAQQQAKIEDPLFDQDALLELHKDNNISVVSR